VKIDSLTAVRRLAFLAVLLLMVMIALTAVIQTQSMAKQSDNNKEEIASYIFGVYPALPISQVEKVFAPVALEISQAIGHKIHFQSSSTYEKYSERIAREEFDIAFIHPFDYVLFAEKANYVPIAQKNEVLSAVFVVPQECASILGMRDLKGKRVAMPPEGSAVSYMVKHTLKQAGLDPGKDMTLRYFNTHSSALHDILIGNSDVACTCRSVLRYFEGKMGIGLKVFAESDSIPHSVFVVHSRIPEQEVAAVRDTLASTMLQGVPEDLRKSFVVGDKKPFVRISDSNMDEVRQYLKEIEGQ
jgi:ABC-type phosphate/phosphonate transport system substrate-binding protein